jgi:hypothetical protein
LKEKKLKRKRKDRGISESDVQKKAPPISVENLRKKIDENEHSTKWRLFLDVELIKERDEESVNKVG